MNVKVIWSTGFFHTFHHWGIIRGFTTRMMLGTSTNTYAIVEVTSSVILKPNTLVEVGISSLLIDNSQ